MSRNFENIIALHASPALVGIKSANMISISYKMVPNLLEEIEEFNKELGHKIYLSILKEYDDRALVLVYKYDKLYNALFSAERRNYLMNHGYPDSYNLEDYLDVLKGRLNNDSFPHEIGVFLDYDLDDIVEFENNNTNCIYVGYWKVYKDKESKIKLFDRYTKSRTIISSLVNKGYSLKSLIA